jgi:hypothetical protein
MPGDTRSDWVIHDFLVASYAKIYLPIVPGSEFEALALLTSKESLARIRPCVEEFLTWRQDQFRESSLPLPTWEQILAIGPELATSAGASVWSNNWEEPRRRFIVLDEWAETVPTDGVHVEPALSQCGTADEARLEALRSDLATAAARRELIAAKAEASRTIAARDDVRFSLELEDSSE